MPGDVLRYQSRDRRFLMRHHAVLILHQRVQCAAHHAYRRTNLLKTRPDTGLYQRYSGSACAAGMHRGGRQGQSVQGDQAGCIEPRSDITTGQHKRHRQATAAAPVENQVFALLQHLRGHTGKSAVGRRFVRIHAGVVQTKVKGQVTIVNRLHRSGSAGS